MGFVSGHCWMSGDPVGEPLNKFVEAQYIHVPIKTSNHKKGLSVCHRRPFLWLLFGGGALDSYLVTWRDRSGKAHLGRH